MADQEAKFYRKLEFGDYVKWQVVREYHDKPPVTEILTGLVIGLFNGQPIVADLGSELAQTYVIPREAIIEHNYEPVDLLTKAIIFVQ